MKNNVGNDVCSSGRQGPDQRQGGINIPEALILGSIPFLAYLLSFAYEAGFIKRLGIPPNLVSLSFIDVLKNSIPLLFSFFISSQIVILYYFLFVKGKKLCWYSLFFIVLIAFLCLAFWYSWFPQKHIQFWTIFPLFIFNLWLLRNVKVPDIWDKIREVHFAILPFTLAVMLAASYFQGFCCAKSIKGYLVIEPKINNNVQNIAKVSVNSSAIKLPTQVVLRIYGDLLICADVRDTIIENYRYKKLCDVDSVMVLKDIGPLKKRND
jgi:hypothetical protein